MQNHTHYSIAIVALVLIFGTVAPLGVRADDTATINNAVSASSHTGGQNGADGRDGQHGADGADGTDGDDGADGRDGANVTTGDSSASVHIETNVDGETVTDVHKTATATDGSTASVYATTSTGTTHVWDEGGTTTATANDRTVAAEQNSALRTALTSIQNILKYYVSLLF